METYNFIAQAGQSLVEGIGKSNVDYIGRLYSISLQSIDLGNNGVHEPAGIDSRMYPVPNVGYECVVEAFIDGRAIEVATVDCTTMALFMAPGIVGLSGTITVN